jgi:hypothetical protein
MSPKKGDMGHPIFVLERASEEPGHPSEAISLVNLGLDQRLNEQ